MPPRTPARALASGSSSSPLPHTSRSNATAAPPPLHPTTPGNLHPTTPSDASEKRSSLRIRLIQDTSKPLPPTTSSAKKRAGATHLGSSSSASDSGSDGDFYDFQQQQSRRGRGSSCGGGEGWGSASAIGRAPGGGLLSSSARDWCGDDVNKDALLQVELLLIAITF